MVSILLIIIKLIFVKLNDRLKMEESTTEVPITFGNIGNLE